MIGLFLSPLAAADPCDTPALHLARAGLLVDHEFSPALLDVPRRPAITAPPPPDGAKATREASGNTLPNLIESTNFALKWGDAGGVDRTDADALIDALEHAWNVEMDELGYPAPVGTAGYRLNVYIADTGPGSPSPGNFAAYQWYDAEGYPILVFSKETVADRTLAATTASHELFHAVQASFDTLQYDGPGDWWFEATAMWVQSQTHPELASEADFLIGFALLPELPLSYFKYPETGSLDEYHQYGAALFAVHLEQRLGGPDVIRRTWAEAPLDGSPLDVLDDIVPEGVAPVIFDFAFRNATMAYAKRDGYLAALEAWDGLNGAYSHRPNGTLTGAAGDLFEPDRFPPQNTGANYWVVRDLPAGGALVFDGDPSVAWGVALVTRAGDAHAITPIPVASGVGALEVDAFPTVSEAWVVVTPFDGLGRGPQTYDYALSVVDGEIPEDPWGSDTGTDVELPLTCACGSASPTTAWPLLGLIPLLFRRRQPVEPR